MAMLQKDNLSDGNNFLKDNEVVIDNATDSKPPNDKDAAVKPPNDKSITQEIIRRSIKGGDIQIVAQLEILESGSTIITVYKERKKKRKESDEESI